MSLNCRDRYKNKLLKYGSTRIIVNFSVNIVNVYTIFDMSLSTCFIGPSNNEFTLILEIWDLGYLGFWWFRISEFCDFYFRIF